ncbi:CLUMA_CG021330, isoform A [Clunio marinus]|uniref:CLUMA_CG021330, isoform A n=1 Tax=Clunio marinus TaxID=568069 RepID=A0A1J1JBM3_9DIPT|nr:CLUMA_CG021330, isoform A [Clunio marinus]
MGLVVVHTGAGNFVNEENYKVLCKKACRVATELLDAGGSAVDACEKAITILEDSCHTNAGFGSNLTWDRKVECEAGIMDSKSTNFGACTCVSNVKNPISLARKICDKQSSLFHFGRIPPILLSSDGASEFAKETGITLVTMDQLISKKASNTYNYYRSKINEFERMNLIEVGPLDTVGAIAIDNDGNVAAGCSSGGIVLKLSGRVGQAACYGAGCWSQKVDNHSTAVCTTGNGEYLIKTLLAREISCELLNCDCPTTKLNQVFNEKFLKSPLLPPSQEYYGGCLVIDYNSDTNRGDLLWAHTTKMLCLAYKSSKMKTSKFIASSLPDPNQAGNKVIVSGIPFSL